MVLRYERGSAYDLVLLERTGSGFEQYCLIAHLYTKSALMGSPTLKAGHSANRTCISESFLGFFLLLFRFWCW